MMVRKAKKFIESIYPELPDAWERYVHTTIKINQDVRQRCQQQLAERLADIEAERDNPELQRYHAAQAMLLQAQIDNHTAIIDKYTAPPPGPKWIKADKPRKIKKEHRLR